MEETSAAGLRRQMVRSLSEDQLRNLCFDYFPDVYDQLASGMSKDEIARRLIDYARKQKLIPNLRAALHEINPQVFPPLELDAPATAPTRNPRQVFISHAHQDAKLAQWLAAQLALHGWQSWIAPESIRPGEKWVEAINRGLAQSGVFVLVLTEAAVQSRWVISETNFAIQSEHQGKLKFVPLKTTPHDIADAPPLWQTYQQVRFDTDRKAGLEALLTELEPQKMAQLARKYAVLQKAMQASDWETALSTGQQLEAGYPDYRDVRQLLAQATEGRKREQQQATRLETLYIQLTAALSAREWEKALDIGEQILGIDRLYRDVKQLMTTATIGLQNQKREARLTRLYLQLQTAFEMGNWQDVQGYAAQIGAIDHNYRDVPQLLTIAQQKLQPPAKATAAEMPQPTRRAAAPATSKTKKTTSAKNRFPTWVWWLGAALLLALVIWGIRSIVTGGSDGEDEALVATRTAEALAVVPSETPAPIPTMEIEENPEEIETLIPTLASMESQNPGVPPPQPTLGSSWQRPTDEMTMVYVPEGTFPMGSEDGGSDESPVHDVTLDGFWIDQTEVTNAQYALCIEAGICSGSVSGEDDHPVVNVNWHEAEAYCAWVGGKLPTEAQWEYAARGEDGRIYPWGDETPDCEIANYSGCVGDTSPVGSYPDGASWVGALDMAGNVWEWASDWYASDYYENSPAENPEGPNSSSSKVVRGGARFSYAFSLRTSNRNRFLPEDRYFYVGFRCASTPF